MVSRSERHEVNRSMTFVATTWRTDDDHLSSYDGFWLSDEERSDIGLDSTSGSESLPQEDSEVPLQWSHSQIGDLY